MQRLMDERRAIGAQLAGSIQRKADTRHGPPAAVPEGGGAALSAQQRARFEARLGADLSDVRVHTGAASAGAAAGMQARAFTVGNDVHFNAGEFAPGSKEGDRLLAHELTHVVQAKNAGVQRKPDAAVAGGGPGSLDGAAGQISQPVEPAEKEADAVADGVAESLHEDQGESAHHAGATEAGQRHAAGAGGSEAKADEAPAPIAAKYVGAERKVFRAKNPGTTPPPRSPPIEPRRDEESSLEIEAKTDARANPPAPMAASRDPGAWAAYEQNWAGAFLPKLKENGISEPTIAGLAGKKSGWFEDAYNAVESGIKLWSIGSLPRFRRSRLDRSGIFGRAVDRRRAWRTRRSKRKVGCPLLRALARPILRRPRGLSARCGSRPAMSESCSTVSSISRRPSSTGRSRRSSSGSALRRTMRKRRPEPSRRT